MDCVDRSRSIQHPSEKQQHHHSQPCVYLVPLHLVSSSLKSTCKEKMDKKEFDDFKTEQILINGFYNDTAVAYGSINEKVCIRLPSDPSDSIVSFGREKIVQTLEASCPRQCRSCIEKTRRRKRCSFCLSIKQAQRHLSKELVAFAFDEAFGSGNDHESVTSTFLQIYVKGSNAAMVMLNEKSIKSNADVSPIALDTNPDDISTCWYGKGDNPHLKIGDCVSFVNLDALESCINEDFSTLRFVVIKKKISRSPVVCKENLSPEMNTQILPMPTFSIIQTQHSVEFEVSHDFAPTVNFSSDDKIDSISLNTIKIIRQKFEPSSWKHALLGIIEKKCEENTTVTEMDCVILPSLISDIKLGLD